MNKGTFLAFVFCLPLFFGSAARAQNGVYSLKKVVLDPGHGGPGVPGATGGGFREKDVVLDVALRVGTLIERNLPGVEVIYTRKTDVNVDLAERGNIANRADADLFVSIHADAVRSTAAHGSSSWVMGLSKEADNLELAMRENSVIAYEEDYRTRYEGFDPNDPASYIMFALMQSAHFDRSIELATLFQKHYGANTSIDTSRGVKQNVFLVLHRTAMPAVLTEIGFISNAKDRAYITSEKGKEQIARSIFEAIAEYKSRLESHGGLRVAVPAANAAGTAAAATTSPRGDVVAASAPGGSAAGVEGAAAPLFRIQVSAARERVPKTRFESYSRQVVEIRHGNLYKYFVGETDSYSEALRLRQRVRRTFRDAFIVPFVGGEIVPLTENMKHD